jgi:hypothetical protein
MLTTAESLQSALAGGPLEGRRVLSVPVEGSDDAVFAVECGADELLAVWSDARGRVDTTGRWPVLATDWGGGGLEDVLTPWQRAHPGVTADSIRVDGARQASAAAITWKLSRGGALIERPADVSYQVRKTQEALGIEQGSPDVPDWMTRGSWTFFDHWLFRWELEQVGTTELARRVEQAHNGPFEWFIPPEPILLLFLPTADGFETPAYLSFYGMEGPAGSARLIALLRDWKRQFGAELVAHWDTMLQFLVDRPPADADEAWDIAWQHDVIANSFLGQSSVELRHHAAMLMREKKWFLEERP